jgi:iron(II)-dependent oxidoreductase
MDVRGEPIVSEGLAARAADRQALAQHLASARARTLALFAASRRALGGRLSVPCTPELNPPIWELGHVGWFADWWIGRNPQRHLGTRADPSTPRTPARQAARGLNADALYDSSHVPHDARWQRPLPDADTTVQDLQASLQETLRLLADAADTDDGLYFFRLALFHEDMHAEAAEYMAQTLEYDPFSAGAEPHAPALIAAPGEPLLHVPATNWSMGEPGPGFAFDNELGSHTQEVAAFQIDAAPVTWARFLPFVMAGGYEQPAWWSEAGWSWRCAQHMQLPRHLRRAGTHHWEQQRWGRWLALDPQDTACHLSAYEAEAWCAWAGRALPTEAQWEIAAHTAKVFSWGQVWEWTATPFAPFPGFQAHPYRDYSAPWFHSRPVLKGASPATAPRMRHPRYRNYFTPERNDVMTGFRSVSR